jgi:hypothetical protein
LCIVAALNLLLRIWSEGLGGDWLKGTITLVVIFILNIKSARKY